MTFEKFWEAVDVALWERGDKHDSGRNEVMPFYRAFVSMTPDQCAEKIIAARDKKLGKIAR